ncbi:MAG: alpha,alpha-trehalase TreF [Oligoflexales bacterium]|nr:alpha,alpha-trehalase TreF [Oligoflexales bacterium]
MLSTILTGCHLIRNDYKLSSPAENVPVSCEKISVDGYGGLFEAVQMKGIFPDSKTFADAAPKSDPAEIVAKYEKQKNDKLFNLSKFVSENFTIEDASSTVKSLSPQPIEERINTLWPLLTRNPEKLSSTIFGSRILLPHPYVVPGGRFNEMYYWDSYFTMLGLMASGKEELVHSMLLDYKFLIEQYGHIPNATRSYLLSRSQPPVLSLMVSLLADKRGSSVFHEFAEVLEKEHAFWTEGTFKFAKSSDFSGRGHLVHMPDDSVLNRYWDELTEPRPESFREDVELAAKSTADKKTLYRDVRAACESGWDFSSRWFEKGSDLATIHTTDIIPVDLNALLYNHEMTLAKVARMKNDEAKAVHFEKLANQRADAINKYMWDEKSGFYRDFDMRSGRQTSSMTLAGVFPLYAGIASPKQADAVAKTLEEKFLRPGGLVTTLTRSGQQWDAPNGWAPLQLVAFEGLMKYGHTDLATDIAQRWLKLNRSVFERTGKMMEKYNVEDIRLLAGGGEYPSQDGFGWTNGVYLYLEKRLKELKK